MNPYGSYQRTRWAPILWGVGTLWLLLLSCSTVSSSRKYVDLLAGSRTPSTARESFLVLWEERTVYFGAGTPGGRSLSLVSPFTTAGEPGGGDGEFPLEIAATLMDSLLIEAGLQYYAELTKMTPEEKTAFRSAYLGRFGVENHLLIWCQLQTTAAELFLDLDRWVVFIEDDAMYQHEPVRVLDESRSSHKTSTDSLPGFPAEPRPPRWSTHQKTVMLCFPKTDSSRNPILSQPVQFLKLIFQLKDDEKTRAEGMWVFKK
ncbi:MAG: hypothetical protein WCE90_13180 [Candidatus Zixiibacteriota bacterium]